VDTNHTHKVTNLVLEASSHKLNFREKGIKVSEKTIHKTKNKSKQKKRKPKYPTPHYWTLIKI